MLNPAFCMLLRDFYYLSECDQSTAPRERCHVRNKASLYYENSRYKRYLCCSNRYAPEWTMQATLVPAASRTELRNVDLVSRGPIVWQRHGLRFVKKQCRYAQHLYGGGQLNIQLPRRCCNGKTQIDSKAPWWMEVGDVLEEPANSGSRMACWV